MAVATEATEAAEEGAEADQAKAGQENSEKEDASHVEKRGTSREIAQTDPEEEDLQ